MNELYRDKMVEGRCPLWGLIFFWNNRHFTMRVFACTLGHYFGVIT